MRIGMPATRPYEYFNGGVQGVQGLRESAAYTRQFCLDVLRSWEQKTVLGPSCCMKDFADMHELDYDDFAGIVYRLMECLNVQLRRWCRAYNSNKRQRLS